MNILFVHNNFPAQFRGLAEALARDTTYKLAAIGAEAARAMPRINLVRYRMPVTNTSSTHSFARRFDIECRRAEQVLFAATELAESGFQPTAIIVHCGWGENLPLRSVFPKARILTYCEFYYQAEGQDVHFEAEGPQLGVDGLVALHCKNASTLLALVDSEIGFSPTNWQRSTYPEDFRAKIKVVHEGVDLDRLKPNPFARFTLPGGETLHRGLEVVTYISRSLEPMRGYHIFIRALPEIMRQRPNAQIIIVGGESVGYGSPSPDGSNWKTHYLNETLRELDLSRVHFLPPQSYDEYVKILQISSVHVYLTYPFVLSWSLIEAMAAGCTVVASDTEPVREAIIDGENGILRPFHDVEAIAEAIVYACSDSKLGRRLGQAARETAAARYDIRKCVPEAIQLLGLSPVTPHALSSQE